jgi:hypothetical protein
MFAKLAFYQNVKGMYWKRPAHAVLLLSELAPPPPQSARIGGEHLPKTVQRAKKE